MSSLVAVTCALPPIPEFGMVTYDRRIRGNTTDYGVRVTFKCNPPHILIGESRAQCTASGTWTEIPKCQGRKVRQAGGAVRTPRVIIVVLQEVFTTNTQKFDVIS